MLRRGESGLYLLGQGIQVARVTPGTVGGWLPTDVGGLLLWLRADTIGGLSDGDPVSTWPDESGNSDDATAAGDARPTWQTGELNGLPVVRFDGGDDVMGGGDSKVDGTVSYVFVINHTSVGNFPDFDCIIGGETDSDTDLGILGNNGSTSFYTGGDLTNVYVNNASTTNFTPLQTFKIVYAENVEQWTTNYQLGHDRQNAGRFWAGDFAEIIVYNAGLSTANREAAQDYLAAKYNITLS